MGLFDLFDDVTDTKQTTTVNLRDMADINQGQGELAEMGQGVQRDQLQGLMQLLTQGGQAQAQGDVQGARQESMNLIDMLRNAMGGPSQQNTAQAQRFSQSIFAPQEQALQQQFKQSETDTSRLAARLGRPVNDPILRAKLAESQGNAAAQLQAQKGAFTAQNAMGFQQQGLDLQSQIAGIRGGLATQALQNRQALFGLGQSLVNQERNFRLATAGQTTMGQTTQQGGLMDAIGAGAAIGGTLMGMPSFGGGASAAGTAGAGSVASMGPNRMIKPF
jgi:hypothetical protein